MDRTERKAAVDAYKERRAPAGIYAVRCVPTGECWVGQSPDLSKIQNRIWFSLRQNYTGYGSLSVAWKKHGADAFTFEVLEALKDIDSDYVRNNALKERHAHWLAALKATAI